MELSKKTKESLLELARARFYFNEKSVYDDFLTKRKMVYIANQLNKTMKIIERLLDELKIDWRNYSGTKGRIEKRKGILY